MPITVDQRDTRNVALESPSKNAGNARGSCASNRSIEACRSAKTSRAANNGLKTIIERRGGNETNLAHPILVDPSRTIVIVRRGN